MQKFGTSVAAKASPPHKKIQNQLYTKYPSFLTLATLNEAVLFRSDKTHGLPVLKTVELYTTCFS